MNTHQIPTEQGPTHVDTPCCPCCEEQEQLRLQINQLATAIFNIGGARKDEKLAVKSAQQLAFSIQSGQWLKMWKEAKGIIAKADPKTEAKRIRDLEWDHFQTGHKEKDLNCGFCRAEKRK